MLGSHAFGAEVLFEEDEVVFIADVAVLVEVNLSKQLTIDVLVSVYPDSV